VGGKAAVAYPKDSDRIADWFRESANDLEIPLPVLSYQSINRMADRRSDFSSSTKQLNDRRCGYTDCLDAALDDKFIRKWCYAMMRKSGKSRRYDLFREAVVRVMQRMDENQSTPDIYFSEEFGADGEFVYEEKDRVMPISFLSAGYQSVLWMVMDIAFRALLLNPGTTDLAQIQGIVLIDEVDKHLHPKWLWNVLEALRETFPGIQFIITTHAPIVIGSCREATIISIAADQMARPIDPVYGYKIEDVIERTQGSPAALKDLKELYVQFEEACIRRDTEQAQLCFDRLDREFPRSTERAKAQTRLRFLKLGG
jgi:predicted ATP-binding protein involved in virulence